MIAQEAGPVKFGGLKKLPYTSPFYLAKRGSIPAEKISLQTFKFERSQISSHLSYDDE